MMGAQCAALGEDGAVGDQAVDWDGLVARAAGLVSGSARRLLGVCGPPGAGKSTLACALAAALGRPAVVVPMDGFHLAQAELRRLDRADRKGAPDTFDPAGYVALLRRLRAATEPVVYAPEFHRGIEEPVAGAIPIPRAVPLVITEGNYLLLDEEPWDAVRGLLDDVWYLDPDEDARVAALIRRHEKYGRSPEVARRFALGSDQRNAERVAAARNRADLVVHGWVPVPG